MSAMQRNKGAEWRNVNIDGGRYAARYQVSDDGQVRAHPNAKVRGLKPGRTIFKSKDDSGYAQVSLRLDYKSHTVKVHRLVAEAFLGAKPVGFTVNHKNGDKTDNRVSNLEYVSNLENVRHAYRVIETRCSVVIDERRMCWTEAVELYGAAGVTAQAAYRRFKRLGWSVHRAITTPIQPTGRPCGGKVAA